MAEKIEFLLSAARGTELWVAWEAQQLGATEVEVGSGLVRCCGNLAVAYQLCLWSRVANRVLLPLHSFPAANAASLYEGVRAVPWQEHIDPRRTMAIQVSGQGNAELRHSLFVAQKTKDAIVDQLRERTGLRPDIDLRDPAVVVHVHLGASAATVSVDLSGPLYKRGYRRRGRSTAAPLKETLAAAILYFADWPAQARSGRPFFDPFCGSGTLAIEAAWMASGVAPGLLRGRFGFHGWRGHRPRLWQDLRAEAEARSRCGESPAPIFASDLDPAVLTVAREHARCANVAGGVRFSCGAAEISHPPSEAPGLLVTNPPYGHRLGDQGLYELYARFGDTLRRHFLGWHAWVFTGNRIAAKHLGLRPARRIPLWNGALECRLFSFPISSDPVSGTDLPHWRRTKSRS